MHQHENRPHLKMQSRGLIQGVKSLEDDIRLQLALGIFLGPEEGYGSPDLHP